MRQHKYAVLDGMRGLAALTVVFAHVSETSCPWLLPHAYLAVDFFFVLSGFVIASAYEDRLRGEMGLGEFVRTRLVRLYPLVILGTVVGAIGFSHFYPSSMLAILVLASLFFIPTPFGAIRDGQNILPLNSPSWTLIWELVANFVYAMIVRRLTNRLLGGIIMVMGAALIATAYLHGNLGVGFAWWNFWGGLPRAGFAFFAGVALCRIRKTHTLEMIRAPLLAVAVVMLTIFVLPRDFSLCWLYDVTAVMIVFPVIIICGTNMVPGWSAAICSWSRQLSYPVYILQGGIWTHLRGLPAHLHLHGVAALPVITVSVIAYVGFAFLAFKFYDEPVRRWFSRRRSRAATVALAQ